MRTIAKAMLAALMAILAASGTATGADPDRSAGICAAYLTVANNPAASLALSMAVNQQRALQFGRNWMNTAARYKNDRDLLQSILIDAEGECRRIGIRSADYR